MSITIIGKRTVYQTSDGAEHLSLAMAEQHILNAELVAILNEHGFIIEGQTVLNLLSSNRAKLRAWLDACDQMERSEMESSRG